MPSYEDQGTIYGNLQYYKYYIRPTSQRLFGDFSNKSKNKHSEIIQNLLELLALNGSKTTWQLAKIRLLNDIDAVRTKEKEYRRLIVGRDDRKKHYPGLLELGLVVKDGLNFERAPSNRYRLSLHGILYAIDVFDFDNTQIDKIAENYSTVIPKIFGKWEFLKKYEPKSYNKLKGLSKGLLLDNVFTDDVTLPLNELMNFLQIKYRRNYDYIQEKELSEQISLWFYTSILISKSKKKGHTSNLIILLDKDKELYQWYMKFYKDAKIFYEKRLDSILKFNA